jgi:hypothetical protein
VTVDLGIVFLVRIVRTADLKLAFLVPGSWIGRYADQAFLLRIVSPYSKDI